MRIQKSFRLLRNLFVPLAMVVMLSSGCSYFDAPDPDAPRVDLMSDGEFTVVEEVAPRDAITFDDIAHAASTKNVKVYGLTGEIPRDINAPLSSMDNRVRSTNPSVEVFPLDGVPVGAPYVRMPAAVPLTPVSMNDDTAMNNVSVVEPASDVARIYFAHGSSALNAQDKAVLNNVSQTIGNRPVRVVGFASTQAAVSDPVARKQVNLRESLDRAYAAAKVLIGQGVPANNIETVGMGENARSADGADARRVEIQPR